MVGGRVDAPARTPNARGARRGAWTNTGKDSWVAFQYVWTFGETPSSYANSCVNAINGAYANDIAVTAPTVTCG